MVQGLVRPGRRPQAIHPAQLVDSKGDTRFLFQFISVCGRGSLHFQQRHQKRKGRFRSLILVDAVGVQAIPATARCGIINRNLQVVPAQKPAEYPLCFFKPEAIFSEPENFKAGRDSRASFYRLLIEALSLIHI